MVVIPLQNIMDDIERLKSEAGIAACDFIRDGMKLGLGTGSTVRYTVIEIGRRISEEGLSVVGVPTSEATRELAEKVGIPLISLAESGGLDLVIDGGIPLKSFIQNSDVTPNVSDLIENRCKCIQFDFKNILV